MMAIATELNKSYKYIIVVVMVVAVVVVVVGIYRCFHNDYIRIYTLSLSHSPQPNTYSITLRNSYAQYLIITNNNYNNDENDNVIVIIIIIITIIIVITTIIMK